MTRHEVLQKTATMRARLDTAAREPKWAALERLYADILAGRDDADADGGALSSVAEGDE